MLKKTGLTDDPESTGMFTTKHVHKARDPTGLVPFAKTVCGRSQEHSTTGKNITCEDCKNG